MVDMVITAADVARVDGSVQTKNAGVAISAGETVRVVAGVLELCEKDQSVDEAECAGIALNAGDIGQPITYQVSGNLDPGGPVALGEVYVIGSEPGGIAPVADITTNDFATVVGIGTAAGNLKMGLLPSGVAAD